MVTTALWLALSLAATDGAPPPATPTTGDNCAGDLLCWGLGDLEAPLQERRLAMRVLMGVVPLGVLVVPRLLVDETRRPAFRGGLRRSTLLHGCGPCSVMACTPPAGYCGGLPVGTLLGGVLGPVILAIVGGVAGFIVIPAGGTCLGVMAGGVVGVVVGAVVGAVLGLTLGSTAGVCGTACPVALWQLYLGPTTVLHEYNQALGLEPYRQAPAVVDPPTPPPQAPPPQAPVAPAPAPDEGVTVK
ncbi:MAG: hypothetical protein HY904_07825 [Deltaproteobacteria bacterium]|nr:hypothetical protein [Deltaproteobacteria bacterium]